MPPIGRQIEQVVEHIPGRRAKAESDERQRNRDYSLRVQHLVRQNQRHEEQEILGPMGGTERAMR